MKLLEVCIDNIEAAEAAIAGGADRLEVCARLEVGGLTPDLSLITSVQDISDIPLHIMLRSRQGDFCYTDDEIKEMESQLAEILTRNVQGIVFGCLTSDLEVDTNHLERISSQVGESSLVFHRAIDECANIFRGFEALRNAEIREVLTSGGEPTAVEGKRVLKSLQEMFGAEISLLAGSGIKVGNVEQILKETSVTRIHGSFKGSNGRTSAKEVARVKEILHAMD